MAAWNGVEGNDGFDVYPVDLEPDLAVIDEYIGHAKTAAPHATPISVLQGFGMADMGIDVGPPGRRPTRAETRSTAFVSAIAGARAIYWYGQSAIKTSDALWNDERGVFAVVE